LRGLAWTPVERRRPLGRERCGVAGWRPADSCSSAATSTAARTRWVAPRLAANGLGSAVNGT